MRNTIKAGLNMEELRASIREEYSAVANEPGGLLKLQLEQKVMAAGFKEVEVVWGKDVFNGAPQHSDAAAFGTLGVTIRAHN